MAALLAGLLGGVHCVGMCGGIVCALSLSASPAAAPSRPNWPFLLAYNAGRIISYSVAGLLAGLLGEVLLSSQLFPGLRTGMLLLASVFLLLLGLYIGNWWRGLARVEQAGGWLWRRIEPYGRRFIPLQNISQAFVMGTLWGWLPCGLVYSMLILAVSSGSAFKGALLLFVFGLGTLPNLLLMGLLADRLRVLLQQRWLRSLAGAGLILMGSYYAYSVLLQA
ncbi:MAG: sulfite exporter TauE/SafE family protein [gamma proteobacterium symbiont of Bathyaustriella thionipta]|nr:sulfite exporter TauE/SafE family protein [gamma proteobacterium symbiont of Bathyaustriella thionipta]